MGDRQFLPPPTRASPCRHHPLFPPLPVSTGTREEKFWTPGITFWLCAPEALHIFLTTLGDTGLELNKILVSVDFSEFSDKAVEYALLLARAYKAELTLVHVLTSFHKEDEETYQSMIEDMIKKRQARIRQNFEIFLQKESGKDFQANFTVIQGNSVADALTNFLQSNPFDLLLMGTHGRSGLKHFVPGSVAEKMTRTCPIPLLTVHRSVTEYRLKRILVPVDFSSYCRDALAVAGSLAETFSARLIFLHAIEQEIPPYFFSGMSVEKPLSEEGLHRLVLANLKDFVADIVGRKILADFVIREGVAHQQIIEYVRDHPVDLLAIAPYGLSGLEYLLLGGTAEKVIRWVTCPVLTVRSVN